MTRRIALVVAAGATALFSLSGCATQGLPAAVQPATASSDLCSVLPQSVGQALEQAGVSAGAPASRDNACVWTDKQSGTTVSLSEVKGGEKDQAPTTAVPGAGPVSIVSPQEVRFTAGGKVYDITIDSTGTLDPTVLVRVVGAMAPALGSPGAAASAAPAPAGSSTEQGETTVTVTDDKGRTTDLQASTFRVMAGERFDLDSGQTVPLSTVTKVTAAHSSTGTAITLTLADGREVTGGQDNYVTFSGDSDFGKFEMRMMHLKSLEFRKDTPFVATPDPQLGPWDAATIAITKGDGSTATVPASSLRVVGSDYITLENGQDVPLQRIAGITAKHNSVGTMLKITMLNGTSVSGSVDDHVDFTADGTPDFIARNLTSMTVKRA
jgi:hypothetical protein